MRSACPIPTDPADVMFPEPRDDRLSPRDARTLRLLYDLPPGPIREREPRALTRPPPRAGQARLSPPSTARCSAGIRSGVFPGARGRRGPGRHGPVRPRIRPPDLGRGIAPADGGFDAVRSRIADQDPGDDERDAAAGGSGTGRPRCSGRPVPPPVPPAGPGAGSPCGCCSTTRAGCVPTWISGGWTPTRDSAISAPVRRNSHPASRSSAGVFRPQRHAARTPGRGSHRRASRPFLHEGGVHPARHGQYGFNAGPLAEYLRADRDGQGRPLACSVNDLNAARLGGVARARRPVRVRGRRCPLRPLVAASGHVARPADWSAATTMERFLQRSPGSGSRALGWDTPDPAGRPAQRIRVAGVPAAYRTYRLDRNPAVDRPGPRPVRGVPDQPEFRAPGIADRSPCSVPSGPRWPMRRRRTRSESVRGLAPEAAESC